MPQDNKSTNMSSEGSKAEDMVTQTGEFIGVSPPAKLVRYR